MNLCGPRRCNGIVLPVAILGEFSSTLTPAGRGILRRGGGLGRVNFSKGIHRNTLCETSNCPFCGADRFSFSHLLTRPSRVTRGFSSCLGNFSSGVGSVVRGFRFTSRVGGVMSNGILCIIVRRFGSGGNSVSPSGVASTSVNCIFRRLVHGFSRDCGRRTKTRFADHSVVCLVARLLVTPRESRVRGGNYCGATCSVAVNASRVLNYLARHVGSVGTRTSLAYCNRRFGPRACTVTGTSVLVRNNGTGGVGCNSALSRSTCCKCRFSCVVDGPPFNVS